MKKIILSMALALSVASAETWVIKDADGHVVQTMEREYTLGESLNGGGWAGEMLAQKEINLIKTDSENEEREELEDDEHL